MMNAKNEKKRISKATDEIEKIAFFNYSRIGIGGSMSIDLIPEILFKNGDVCTDIKVSIDKSSLKSHKKNNPQSWTTWKEENGNVYVKNGTGWDKPAFTLDRSKMIKTGEKIEASFTRTRGSGNVDGTNSAIGMEKYTFHKDGSFEHEGIISVHSEFDDGYDKSVADSYYKKPNQKGKYYIDNYTLILTYEKGLTSTKFLITFKDDLSMIWIDGMTYMKSN